jgi:DNA transformation protein and related proteins
MDDAEIEEMFAGLGAVTIRRMFGGKGIYHRGRIFAVDLHGEVLLKADAESAPAFEAAGARRWVYEGRAGKPVAMPYWSIPDEALDDPEIMAQWAHRAFAAACRSAATNENAPAKSRGVEGRSRSRPVRRR